MFNRLVVWIKDNRKECLFWGVYLLLVLADVASEESSLSGSLWLGAVFVFVRLILLGNKADMS